MKDEGLEQAVRRVLRARAAAVSPGPGHVPDGAGTAATGRWRWRRAPLVWTAAVAAAVAVALIAGLALSGDHTTTVSTGPGPSTSTPAATVAPNTTTPATTAAPTTAEPATTAPPEAVPAGFVPVSVTFVSAQTGWVLGEVPCPSGWCATMARTRDGGATWAAVPAPGVTMTAAGQMPRPVTVRFADPQDGWVYTPSQLWSTHDGGATWAQQPVPGGGSARISDLEASAGQAYLAALRPGAGIGIFATPAAGDSWTGAPFSPGLGAGPVPSSEIVLQGRTGWIVTDNRTAVSGARNLAGAGWTAWIPPCADAHGDGYLAAASTTDLVALCAEGTWGPPAPGTTAGRTWMFRSGNAGDSFTSVSSLPENSLGSLAVAPGQPGSVLTVTAGGILATFDGGATWSTVYRGPQGSYPEDDYVGFTTTTQAVAVLAGSSGTQLLMSHDGGHRWSVVSF